MVKYFKISLVVEAKNIIEADNINTHIIDTMDSIYDIWTHSSEEMTKEEIDEFFEI